MRSLLLSALFIALAPSFAWSQTYTLSVEEYVVDGIEGMTTYRLYIDMVNPDDFLSAVFGNDAAPLLISTPNGFYNDAYATGGSADGINPSFLLPPTNLLFPGLAYDSWYTIGIEHAPQGEESSISGVESPNQPWVGCFDATSVLSGEDVAITDSIGGAWYLVSDPPNGFPNDNMQVLIAQITADAAPSGTINVQVFPNGDGDERFSFAFDGPGTYDENGPVFVPIFGCTNSNACNYNPAANTEDDTCVYADGNCEICNAQGGVTVQDADGDGVCDGDEIDGCTDSSACNYDDAATDPATCVYADGNCEICNDQGGVTVQDADGDGVCDSDEIAGCQDSEACNYDDAATDPATCVYADGNCEICNDQGGVTVQDADGDGVCDSNEIAGCQDAEACNYDDAATESATCVYADGNCEICNDQGGVTVQDADGDGVCDSDEIMGCTDNSACNFSSEATEEDGSCDYCSCGGTGGGEPTEPTYSVTVEEYAVDAVAGQTTYRFYIDMVNADDFLSSIYGNANAPLELNTTTSFFNDPAATGGSAGGINPSFLLPPLSSVFPNLGYDSWYTIGIEYAPQGNETGVSGVESPNQPWIGCFDATSELSGQNVAITDATGGAWYILNSSPNGIPDADNQRVLCLQLTTDGDISGSLTAQIFGNGDGDNDFRFSFAFSGVGTFYPEGTELIGGGTGANPLCGCTNENAANYNPDAIYDDGSCLDAVLGCTDSSACNYNPNANSDDGSCLLADGNCEVCNDQGGISIQDTDGDGVCDGDEIAGCQDNEACNYDASATDPGTCVYADGNCEVCHDQGGVSVLDADGDGVCDGDEIAGCQDSEACNYDASATDPATCVYADGNCEVCNDQGGVSVQDADGDGVCDGDEIAGCQDSAACNYDALATDPATCVYADGNCEVCNGQGGVTIQDIDGDGVCDGDEIAGCQDSEACNYDASATDPATCVYADGNCEVCNDQGGVTIQDIDGDGVCDGDEIAGCQDETACNFDAAATDPATCVYADGNCEVCNDQGGVSIQDADGDGVCDGDEIAGCQDSEACNYDASATDPGTCVYADGNCEVCNDQGGVSIQDADGDGVCDGDEIAGCQDSEACNYDASATDPGTCVYADGNCEVCNDQGGVTVQDADGDGVCDGDEIAGCQDENACNYDASATDPATCVYADGNCEVCNDQGGVTVQDADGDGVCDGDEIAGCQDENACNYDAAATDPATCVYADGNCEVCNDQGGVTIQDADGDGVCDGDEIAGCQDSEACNYDAAATDPATCVYADGNCEVCNDQGGVTIQDADGDGVCDSDEIAGCKDSEACNYDASATDPATCVYADGNCEVCNDQGGVSVQDADGDGVCDGDEIAGCQDSEACNYDTSATDPDTCVYADSNCEICNGQGGVTIQDADGDGVCDSDEIAGCQDEIACNYDAAATDPATCVYADGNCEVCNDQGGVSVLDADGDGFCDSDEIAGCQDSEACNYDASATDPATCVYADGNCEVCNDQGGVTVQDADGDGVCDSDETAGCTDMIACNFGSFSDTDNSFCVYADGNCEVCNAQGGVTVQDTDGDGVCDGDEIAGCQDNEACNYDASATDPGTCVYADGNCEVCHDQGGVSVLDADGDGVCDGDEIAGCQNSEACNYDASATDPATCVYADGNCEVCNDQGGISIQDADGDGVCDGDEIAGCQDSEACNYDASATDPATCVYADGNCEVCNDQGGVSVQDADGDGVCDGDEIAGCQDSEACNYDASATDPGTCVYADGNCEVCNAQGGVTVQDADGDGVCDGDEIAGCQDDAACNYDAAATDPAICVYADGNCEICNDQGGVSVQDADGDGVCDSDEIAGCQDAAACNYNANATDPATCVYANGICEICNAQGGVTAQDADGDGVCDGDEIAGCQDEAACNYDATATDAATCEYPEPGLACDCEIDVNNDGQCDIVGCTIEVACNYDPEATVLEIALCEFGPGPGDDCNLSIPGCTDSNAVNYNPNATEDDGSCITAVFGCMIPSACTYDPNATWMDFSMCSWNCTGNSPLPIGTVAPGCTDPYACNYDENATSDDGSCDYLACTGCGNAFACNFDPGVIYPDASCEFESCAGCTNSIACNFDAEATISDNGQCEFVTCAGCTDLAACNFDEAATIEDLFQCEYPEAGLDCNGCEADLNENGICDEAETSGCMNDDACNYAPDATLDDDSCEYLSCIGCLEETACNYDATATVAFNEGCVYPCPGLDCDGNCINDADGDGVCDEDEIAGCDDPTAINYHPAFTDADNNTCVYEGDFGVSCYDFSGDNFVGTADLLLFLQQIGTSCDE